MNEELTAAEKKEEVFRRRVNILKNRIWAKAELDGKSAQVVLQALAEITSEVITGCVDPDDIAESIAEVGKVIHESAGIGIETSH